MMADTHEPRNSVIIIIGIIASLILFLGIFALLYIFNRVAQRELHVKIGLAPSTELAKLRADEAALLHSYAIINRDQGLVRIPIQRAIELEARAPWRTAAALKLEDGGTTHVTHQ